MEITDEEKQLGRIWINNKQYFDNIPLTAWEFYIGGYQPAQKYLKDRTSLDRKSLKHYNKFIDALLQTDEVMNQLKELNSN